MAIIVQPTGSINSATLYAELIANIITLTNRPDLIGETALALRKATMKAHQADFWKSDVVICPQYTLPIPITDPAAPSSRYVIPLNDPVNFALLRKVAWIKEYINPAGQSPNPFISGWDTLIGTYGRAQRQANYDECSPESVVDSYNMERTNYWYQAGKQVALRTFAPIQYAVIGYYAYPNVTPVSYNSWIGNEFPDILVEEAASTVFRMIGKVDESAAYANNWPINLHTITMAQVTVSTPR